MDCIRVLVIFFGICFTISGRSALDMNHKQKRVHKVLSGSYNSEEVIQSIKSEQRFTPISETQPSFWYEKAFEDIQIRLLHQRNVNQAKNLILFLGDGMPVTTVTAARILKGQLKGKAGEEEVLSFERFPYSGLSKTYCTNAQVADSACSATAYLCGIKTNALTIGVTANVELNNCTASMREENQVSSIADWAQAAGMATGIVTKTPVTHASPAGAFAHVANREWQCDADIRDSVLGKEECLDIAQQLVNQMPGSKFDVIMGGGFGKFLPENLKDPFGNHGQRKDKRDLIQEWKDKHPHGALVTNLEDLSSLNLSEVSNLLGLFASNSMSYRCKADPTTQPSLADMTATSIKKLKRNHRGYFLFVEGGLIDYGNHETKATISLDETLEFEEAIEAARSMTNSSDTLIVVTSDHGHAISFAGYPKRGNNIVGLNLANSDTDGVEYMTLNYAVGPRQYMKANGKRSSLIGAVDSLDFMFPSYIKSNLGVHSGEDVAIYASGPYEHFFSGVMEQNSIPHLMAYAACIGNGPTMCNNR